MSTSLLIRFPWGRFHATPWGAHVNEARVELPPSPWRVLRALYSTWRLRRPDLAEDTVVALLRHLAEPPLCHVPPHVLSTSRHYYPDSTHRRGASGATDLTLDAFASIDPATPLAFHWPVTLEGAELDALGALSASTPYFGRAESICEMECTIDWTPDPAGTFAPVDLDDESDASRAGALVELLVPRLPLDLDSLVQRPVDVRRRRLRYPEGSRLLAYRALDGTPVPISGRPWRAHHGPSTRGIEAVRLAFVGPVRPPLTEAVALGDRLRQAALSRLGSDRARDDSRLAGRTAGGDRLLTAHQHAHFLPVSANRSITDLVVWAPAGLGDDEVAAVEGVTFIWSGNRFTVPSSEDAPAGGYDADVASRTKLAVRATAIGDITEVAPELAGPASRWSSITPYTSPRHRKGADEMAFLERDVRVELAARRYAPARLVTVAAHDARSGSASPIEFVRARPSKRFARSGGRAATGGFGQGQAPPLSRFLTLEFESSIPGPWALGHLSHFGLGLFVPD